MICLVNFFLFTKLHEAGSGLQELLAGQHEWDLAGKISYEILCRTLFVFFFLLCFKFGSQCWGQAMKSNCNFLPVLWPRSTSW